MHLVHYLYTCNVTKSFNDMPFLWSRTSNNWKINVTFLIYCSLKISEYTCSYLRSCHCGLLSLFTRILMIKTIKIWYSVEKVHWNWYIHFYIEASCSDGLFTVWKSKFLMPVAINIDANLPKAEVNFNICFETTTDKNTYIIFLLN